MIFFLYNTFYLIQIITVVAPGDGAKVLYSLMQNIVPADRPSVYDAIVRDCMSNPATPTAAPHR